MFNKKFLLIFVFIHFYSWHCFAASTKWPEFGGQFYPSAPNELTKMMDGFLDKAGFAPVSGHPWILISPHAGYGFSGQTAAFGYKLIKNKNYKTVIVIGSSHRKIFNGAALYGSGAFITTLGQIIIDEEMLKQFVGKDPEIFVDASAFSQEHSIEVQLPFLQQALGSLAAKTPSDFAGDKNFKIFPVLLGDCSLATCEKIGDLLYVAIAQRQDVLVVVSTDLYHGYDFKEADQVDKITLDLIQKMDYQELYYALRDGRAQACGGFALVVALNIAGKLNLSKPVVLNQTNSAKVTGKMVKGVWTVGYTSCAIMGREGENMLTVPQKQKLLELARQSIAAYLQTGKKLPLSQADLVLNKRMGAFVTLNHNHQLRGCIGSLVATQPLYLTVRDMAVEAAVGDPRFSALGLAELKDIEIEISVLSELEKVTSAEKIELGKHGVLIRKGSSSGVFLPQVATETGWSKEEFLNNLCAHKAGLPAGAWKDKDTELYIFTADVFSEEEMNKI